MDFALTDEQREIRQAARDHLERHYPPLRVCALAEGPGGSEAGAWPELIRQGWLDDDLGMVELTLLAEESGRCLHPTPWWTTVALAAPYARAAGERLTVPATFADGGGTVRAARSPQGWTLTGQVAAVPQAGAVRCLVVRADTDQGPAVFACDTGSAGLVVAELSTLDTLRRMARVRCDGTPARLLVGPDRAAEAARTARLRGGVLLAAEAVGVAAGALDMAVAHARQREQFGRPIGSFQAVAHQLTEAYVDTESARSLAYRAAWLVQHETEAGAQAVDEAVLVARSAAVRTCETAIQITGGMGVTWEYPLHRWLRRALWLEAYPGFGDDPHDRVAERLLRRADPDEITPTAPDGR
ncbi:acyl-CoA dehydrogenase [Verrucosispora sp. ts21]|uniref:acyl-CoA dehydrogenase family protein n=1 Tax=Verrucosispora sp. ts21 TaxID=2069341 RepID=UPI000C884215|nr:acyl-CoA dehydrogenase family protein [Verrucosispora sp. ts21]PMR62085.1 acyl-CoA dehydrogenase [Verrucosispora sp. ts21]